MAHAPEPTLDDMLWTVAVARIVFGPAMNIQAPPNLSPGLIARSDRGRHQRLGRRVAGDARSRQPGSAVAARSSACARETARGGQVSDRAARDLSGVCRASRRAGSIRRCARAVLRAADADGFARGEDWAPGCATQHAGRDVAPHAAGRRGVGDRPRSCDARSAGRSARRGATSSRCSQARGGEFDAVCAAADALRAERQRRHRRLRRQPQHQLHQHLLLTAAGSAPSPRASSATACAARPTTSTSRRSRAACARPGSAAPPKSACRAASIRATPATTYLDDPATPSSAPCRDIHVHAFSPLEVMHGATSARARRRQTISTGCAARGSAACRAPRRKSSTTRCAPCSARTSSSTAQWLDVIEAAHRRRPAHHRDHHVRPRRPAGALGAAPAAHPRPAGAHRRLHRVRAAAVRAHGGADLSEGPRAQGPDLPRGRADARGRAAGAASAHPQHPGLLGEARARRRAARASTPAPTISAAR